MFDFGNVIGFFDYSVMLRRFGQRLGMTADELASLMYERGAAELGRQFERGSLTAQEFATEVMSRAGLAMSFEEFAADWADIFTLNEPVARLVETLKGRGYTLLLGSNTNVLHANFFRRRFHETLAHFDHLVLSYEVGQIKPDRLFFAACLNAACAPAASCVFIDDAPANVEGARAAGLQALLYRDPLELVAGLRRLGVEIPDGQS
jgi:putative hydrolase of the HAD superfamily